MAATGQFLTEEALPPTTATPSPSFAMARARSFFRRQTQPVVGKDDPGGVFHKESVPAGGSTIWIDPEQTDHSSHSCNLSMTD